ncbi:MAG: site-specific DNA-methyltransferase [Deltaproteobacteria bacterium]|nr:site-specific DNA-methyltransferase [Deltaproteobacteria bacterium]
MEDSISIINEANERFRAAAMDRGRVSGLTHEFYRYPARFSPQFSGAAIERFTEPGDLVLDPYAGGGTTVVEALVRGRKVIGNDINSLAVFVARVKTTPLTANEKTEVRIWAEEIHAFNYKSSLASSSSISSDPRLYNMNQPKTRYVKKIIALALEAADSLSTTPAQEFIRCAVLKTAQWALDGKKSRASTQDFRNKLAITIEEMLSGLEAFITRNAGRLTKGSVSKQRTLIHGDASLINQHPTFQNSKTKVKLVVTSPPYPGVHVLYHRWQVDGRKETPVPYWIARCYDGAGASYYTFGDRKEKGLNRYFETSLSTLQSIRKVMHLDGTFVQLIAFSDPASQLPRYLRNMERAGFQELFLGEGTLPTRASRIWRAVPNRKWHATLNGRTSSSREVVLIHKIA